MREPDLSEGWVVLILLGSLAVSISTVSFGLGFVNLVAGEMSPPPAPTEQAPLSSTTDQAAVVDLDGLRHRLDVARSQLARMLAEEKDLKAEIDQKASASSDRSSASPVDTAEPGTADSRVRQLQEQIAELEAQTRNVKKQIDDVKRVDVAKLFGGGGGGSKKPRWIECVEDAVIIQPEGARVSAADLGSASGPFAEALRSGFVVLLVRPSGFETFEKARAAAAAKKITFGYEPVDQEWQLRF